MKRLRSSGMKNVNGRIQGANKWKQKALQEVNWRVFVGMRGTVSLSTPTLFCAPTYKNIGPG